MTTMQVCTATCGVCGFEQQVRVLTSTNAFGSPDLDLRPPPMKRETIALRIQRCDGCGYCAASLDEGSPQMKSMIESSEYQLQLENPDFPGLANSFLCGAMLHEAAGEINLAAIHLVFAAWACDDRGSTTAAAHCRNAAEAMIVRTNESGQPFCEEGDGATDCLRVDLLRRAGRGADAMKIIHAALPKVTNDILRKVLTFQTALIKRRDMGCYTVSDVVQE